MIATVLLQEMLNNQASGLFCKDNSGKYCFVNNAYAALLDLTPDDFTGKTDAELWPPAVAEDFLLADGVILLPSIIEQLGMREIISENWLVLPNRQNRLLQIRRRPCKLETGEIVCLGFVDDISEQALADNNPDYILRLNSANKVIYTNNAIQKLLKPDSNDHSLLLSDFRWSEQFITAILELAATVRQKGQSQRQQLSSKIDNAALWLDIVITPEYAIDGAACVLLLTARDVTSAQQALEAAIAAKEAAEIANKAKAAFLATMSHEIRTPLNGVIALGKALSTTTLDEKQQEWLRSIRNNANSLINIINDILDFSKLESGKLQIEYLSFSPRALAENTADLMRPQIEGKGLVFELNIADLPEWVESDPKRLQQVLLNLLGNAYKFTEQGKIVLTMQQKPNFSQRQYSAEKEIAVNIAADTVILSIEVTDSGIGISPENQATLFHDFTQADASISRRYGGTGLGLAICKQIAIALNGHIGVVSNFGQGSCFWLEIPCKLSASPEDITVNKLYHLPPLSILAVDDNQVNHQVVRAFLEPDHHKVTCVDDGFAAFQAWQQNDYDIILMDMQMPVCDGIEATKMIRAEEIKNKRRHVPIIALTANIFPEHQQMCLQAGMEGFLQKPLQDTVLLQAISHYTGVKPLLVEIISDNLDNVQLSPALQQWQQREIIDSRFIRYSQSWEKEAWQQTLVEFIQQNLPLADKIIQAQTELTGDSVNWPQHIADSHKLKGGSGNLGLALLSQTMAKYEIASRDHAVTTCLQIVKILPQIVADTRKMLQELATEAWEMAKKAPNQPNPEELTAKQRQILIPLLESLKNSLQQQDGAKIEQIFEHFLAQDVPNFWKKPLAKAEMLAFDENFTQAEKEINELLAKI